jgi:DnaJ family protein C protein 9
VLQDKYRGSEEEASDLLETYSSMQGKMKKVFDRVICSDEQLDSHRFMDMIEEAIEQGG